MKKVLKYTIAILALICLESNVSAQTIIQDANKRWGYINKDGVQILPSNYAKIMVDDYFIYAQKPDTGRWGIYDHSGNVIVKHKFDNIGQQFSDGLLAVCIGDKWGYIDSAGKTVIKFQYKEVKPFNEGLAPVRLNKKWGYIDKQNNIVIPFQYKTADVFSNGLARVGRQAGYGWIAYSIAFPYLCWVSIPSMRECTKYGYIDKDGTKVIPLKYNSASETFDKYGIAKVSKSGNALKSVYITKTTKENYQKYDEALLALGINHETLLKEKTNTEPGIKVKYVYYKKQDYLAQNNNTESSLNTHQNNNDNRTVARQVYDASSINTASNNTTTRQPLNNSSSKSDVDINIPKATRSSENTFAVIIANEDYKRESKVQFAIADGESFKQYCINTLGLPESNVHLITNAGLGDIKHEVNWLTRLGNVYEGNAKLIFYYAGHGVPDESTLSAYLLPVDGYGSDLSTGYKLSELYKQLASCKSKYSIVLLDACFSGAERSGKMMASARGIALKANPGKPTGNLIVLTAASGDETAYPYTEKGHGMFTYYLLKKLKDTNGNATLGEVYEYIKTNVSRTTVIKDMKDQSPSAIPSQTMVNTWKNLTLY